MSYTEIEQDTSASKKAPPPSPDLLSMDEQKSITSSLQFVVGMGVVPHLQSGVGVPLERRSKLGHLFPVCQSKLLSLYM